MLSREFVPSQPVDALEILHAFHQAVCHLLLTGTQRHARIVVLLVGLLRPLGVSNPQLGCVAYSWQMGRLGEVWHLKWLRETAHLSSSWQLQQLNPPRFSDTGYLLPTNSPRPQAQAVAEDLGLQIVLVLLLVVIHAIPEGPLPGICDAQQKQFTPLVWLIY